MNKIYFKGNPYSNGHRIIDFNWSGRLKKDIGLVFDFHLKTEGYDASDNSDNQEKGENCDWKSKAVWCNYGSCTMSSIFWDGNGIIVGNKQKKFI